MTKDFLNISRILSLLVLIIFINSCSSPFEKDGIKEGVIEYEITYLENEMTNFAVSFLPRTMYMKFRNNMSISTIEGFMGVFFVKNITDLRKMQNTTLLKALNNEFFYLGERKEQPCCIGEFGELEFKITEDTLRICDFLCKKAIAKLPDGSSFEVYFTEEIGLKNPNALTPFEPIDGVLMKFQMKLNSVRMDINAKKFYEKKVPVEEFEIPPGFKRISKEKMEEVVNELME